MPLSPNIVVFDLDGTLSNDVSRAHLAREQRWEEYHSEGAYDEPWQDALIVLSALQRVVNIETWILTGRTKAHEKLTLEWLKKHGIAPDRLIMRPDDDFTPSAEMKEILLTKEIGIKSSELGQHILLMLDNDERIFEHFCNLGVNCWLVR